MKRAPFFCLALAAATGLSAQTVTIRPAGDLSSLVGMPLDVPIVADWTARADKLGAFALTLRWDPAVLHFEGGMPGTFGNLTANTDSAPQGVLRLSGANPTGVNGVITLGVARFTPRDSVGTTLQLQVTELYATAPTFADLVGAAVPQNALYCAARGLWGDADVDGTVGSRDALLALSNAVGLDVSAFPQIGLADVDTSGAVDARDALVILSYAVGMDVAGFRIHKLALGSCGTELQTNYAVVPGSDTLVLSQDLRITLQATSTLGAVRTLTDVFWRSSNPTVLAVTQDGRAFAAAAGTATLVGKSGTQDSAVVTMAVVARRTHHVVDAAAINATNQIGSAALPFASLAAAANVTAEGDTVLVRPGHYADPGFFSQGVVILGQPGAGGVVLSTGASPAISFSNGRRAEVRNVAIDNSHMGVEAFGLDTLIVDSLTYTAAAGTCVSEAVGSSDIRQLVVRRSTLTGDGPSGCTTGIDAFGVVQDLTVDSVAFSDLGSDAIYAGAADSVTVRRSTFHDIGADAVSADALRPGGGRLPQPTNVALVFDGNHVVRTRSQAVYANTLRSALVTHSVVDGTGSLSTPVSLNGPSLLSGFAHVSADTLIGGSGGQGGIDWLDAYGMDSVAVDSVTASGFESFFSNVAALRVTRSRIQVLTSGTGIYYNPAATGTLTVDSVTVLGDAACGQCGYGISASNAPVSVNHFSASDVAYGINTNGSSITLTNSVFANVNYGLSAGSCCSGPFRAVVHNVQATNAVYGVSVLNGILVADSVTVTSGSYGVQAGNAGSDTVRTSSFTDVTYPISLSGDTLVATGNTLVRPGYDGIQAYGQSLAGDLTLVSGNTVTCDTVGARRTYAIWSSGANATIANNAVSGCTNAVYVAATTAGLSAAVRGNVIAAPAVATDAAIHVEYGNSAAVAGNQITGGGHSGAVWLRGQSDFQVPRARVDSNTILHVADRAIWADYTDTLTARGNLIDTVTQSGFYGAGPVGIGLAFGGTLDSLERNTIRRAARGVDMNLFAGSAAFDSNAVSVTDSAAVWITAGSATFTGNHIANNHGFGLNLPNLNGLVYTARGNAFVNDSLYGIAAAADSVDAEQNWWGLATGPASGAGSDSASGARVDATNFLTTDPTPSLPPLAPPVRVIALRPVAALASPVRRYVAPPVRTPRPASALAAPDARLALLANRMAAVAGDTSHVARALALRAAGLRARVQADAARAGERAQRAAERERLNQAAARAVRAPPQKGRAGQ